MIHKPYYERYCPACNGSKIADVLYGPHVAEDNTLEIDSEQVVWGGKIIRENGPHWLCLECKTAWCKNNDDIYHMDEFGEFNLQ